MFINRIGYAVRENRPSFSPGRKRQKLRFDRGTKVWTGRGRGAGDAEGVVMHDGGVGSGWKVDGDYGTV